MGPLIGLDVLEAAFRIAYRVELLAGGICGGWCVEPWP